MKEKFLSTIESTCDKCDGRQTEVDTAEPPVPNTIAFEAELGTEKPKDTNHQVLIKCQQD
jgi:hypothetical protein